MSSRKWAQAPITLGLIKAVRRRGWGCPLLRGAAALPATLTWSGAPLGLLPRARRCAWLLRKGHPSPFCWVPQNITPERI